MWTVRAARVSIVAPAGDQAPHVGRRRMAGIPPGGIVVTYESGTMLDGKEAMATINLTASTFDEVVAKDGIVLVDFWAEWCGPCKNFAPIFEKSSDAKEEIVHAKVDTEAEQELGMKFGITAIPTLMAFRDGIMVFNQAGALPGPALNQLVDAVEALDMDEVRAKLAEHEAADH